MIHRTAFGLGELGKGQYAPRASKPTTTKGNQVLDTRVVPVARAVLVLVLVRSVSAQFSLATWPKP